MFKNTLIDNETTIRKDDDFEAVILSATDPLALSGAFLLDQPKYARLVTFEYNPKVVPEPFVLVVPAKPARVPTQPISIPMSKAQAQAVAKPVFSQFDCTQDFVPCSPNVGSSVMDHIDHLGASSYRAKDVYLMTNTSVTAKLLAEVKQSQIRKRSGAPKIGWASPLVVSKENTPINTPDSIPLASTIVAEIAQKMPGLSLS